MNFSKILVVFSIVFIHQLASATIIHVPGDCPTIQEGVDASYDGDTVLVKPGEYVENVSIANKNVVLASHFLTTGDTTYIPITIIDGDSSGYVLRLGGVDSNTIVAGFTIRNGRYSFFGGGGISCGYSGSPVISHNILKNNIFIGNCDIEGGGGIGCYHSSPLIQYNTIINNSTNYLGGGIFCYYSSATIKNNIISNNIAGWGGGISIHDSDPLIINNLIYENSADP